MMSETVSCMEWSSLFLFNYDKKTPQKNSNPLLSSPPIYEGQDLLYHMHMNSRGAIITGAR